VRASTKRTERDHYITMRDINRLRRIVEDEEIRFDPNDAVSIKVWATRLQQAGAGVILKDKIDPPPPGSRLSADTFVLCIQTVFQKNQFRSIGNDFLSIDATHNTTQYAGLQLFSLVARDHWGHGTRYVNLAYQTQFSSA
jgi:hypothetical protein